MVSSRGMMRPEKKASKRYWESEIFGRLQHRKTPSPLGGRLLGGFGVVGGEGRGRRGMNRGGAGEGGGEEKGLMSSEKAFIGFSRPLFQDI